MLSVCKVYFGLLLIFFISSFGLCMIFLVKDLSLFVELNLLNLNSLSVVMTILLDWMSLLFMSFVLLISSMVIIYSEDYMQGDLNLKRFILLVIMFVLSMVFLIISPNLISILLGWDGLGLVSYCLVAYYQNTKSSNAAMLTVLSNRIGDVALLMSIAWMLNFGSWNYIYYLECMKGNFIMELITYFVVLAALTKSAQIPFSSWLPAAMAAPTPVSSLVHSSTLVTAGVYLLIRFNLAFSGYLLFVLLFISMMTMFMSGLGANFEFDLKKIIALSTLSQLGLMMSILALGSYYLSFFHLLTHALFKALLFMCAGGIIHSMGNNQDIRYMGNLFKLMPLTCSFLNICNFSLCGLPFLSGFYSKDLIAEVMSMEFLNMFVYSLFFISVGLTVCYSLRLVYYTLIGELNFWSLNNMGESELFMLKGMFGLIYIVVFSGGLLMWMIFPLPWFICLPYVFKFMAFFMIIVGMLVGYEMAKLKVNYILKSKKFIIVSEFLGSMWNMPIISTLGVNYYPVCQSEIYSKSFDFGWLEYYGAKNVGILLLFLAKFFQIFFNNHLKVYFVALVIWVSFLFMNNF
nr:NADH dehydrogenase subunit 5 [Sarmydus sp. N117]